MCDPLTAVVAGSAILGAGASYVQGKKAAKAQRSAQEQNAQQAQQEAQRMEQQFNRQNQKMPAIAQLFASNRNAANRGLGSTFLTGTKGVPFMPLGGGPSLLGA